MSRRLPSMCSTSSANPSVTSPDRFRLGHPHPAAPAANGSEALALLGQEESFDLVLSVFGAMFAPRPAAVAREMVRVAKPGGRIVMGNWIPGDPTLVAQILKTSAAYSPPPPEGFVSPVTWGVENDVVERFGAAGVPAERISCTRETWEFVHPSVRSYK